MFAFFEFLLTAFGFSVIFIAEVEAFGFGLKKLNGITVATDIPNAARPVNLKNFFLLTFLLSFSEADSD